MGQITDLKSNVTKLTHDNGDLKAKIDQMDKEAQSMGETIKENQREMEEQKKLIQEQE